VARSRHPTYTERKQRWTTYRDPELRKGRMGRPYRRWREAVLAAQVPICWRCGGPIDKRLHWTHPMAATAGHVIPLSRGGAPLDPANGRPEHRRCNLRAGNRDTRVITPSPRPVADRRW